jgi:hypothetical protein
MSSGPTKIEGLGNRSNLAITAKLDSRIPKAEPWALKPGAQHQYRIKRVPLKMGLVLKTNRMGQQEDLFLISAAIVMKACSTLVAFFALVSRNDKPSWSANSLAVL